MERDVEVKKSGKEKAKEEADGEEEEEEEEEEEGGRGGGREGDEEKKKKGGGGVGVVVLVAGKKGSSSGSGGPCCQADKCNTDLTNARRYHRRHRVCEQHSKAAIVVVAGLCQRFCQQCSRFHELTEFDEAKRSCRRRLAGHNERRRKNTSDAEGVGGRKGMGSHLKESLCRHSEHGGRLLIPMPLPASPTYKHFQIR